MTHPLTNFSSSHLPFWRLALPRLPQPSGTSLRSKEWRAGHLSCRGTGLRAPPGPFTAPVSKTASLSIPGSLPSLGSSVYIPTGQRLACLCSLTGVQHVVGTEGTVKLFLMLPAPPLEVPKRHMGQPPAHSRGSLQLTSFTSGCHFLLRWPVLH